MKNPKIISHRGRSDIYPQNTMQSLLEGLMTSDLVEFDVLLTKDEEVIVFHDRFLGQLTNIGFLPEFENRKTVNDLNEFGQVPHSQWWVKEFTLQQIRKLNVRQRGASRPQIMDREFHIPTLDQVIKKCLELKSTQQKTNNSGLLIEIKSERQILKALPRDLILLQKINEILHANNLNSKQKCEMRNLPIIIQSFNQEALKHFHHLNPLMSIAHLYFDEDQKMSEQYIESHRFQTSVGVAISAKHMTRQFVELCHRIKYEVFYWSVVDDKPEIPFSCKTYEECYQYLQILNVDGIITDFAVNCKKALISVKPQP